LWYDRPNAISTAIDYAKFYSRSHDAVIRVYDVAGSLIETHEHGGEFKEWRARLDERLEKTSLDFALRECSGSLR
jgi:hypothetical protein